MFDAKASFNVDYEADYFTTLNLACSVQCDQRRGRESLKRREWEAVHRQKFSKVGTSQLDTDRNRGRQAYKVPIDRSKPDWGPNYSVASVLTRCNAVCGSMRKRQCEKDSELLF